VLRWLAGVVLILAGLAVGSHGWWSGLEEAGAQRVLAAEVAAVPPAAATPAPPSSSPAHVAASPALTPLGGWRPPGPAPQIYAALSIPAIGLSAYVVRGATLTDYYDLLAWGPAHLEGTPEPGAPGNAVIFGHVDEFGAPFRHLAELRAGEAIDLAQAGARYAYAVQWVRLVPADDLGIVESTPGTRALTLFTCGGPANRDRVAVYATLAAAEVAAPAGRPR
jgi:sortase A